MIIVLYAGLAMICDMKFFKIPNLLCLITAVTGIWFSVSEYGVSILSECLIGMFMPIGILYLLFYCQMIGAGDIKEFAALGTFFGRNIWKVIVVSFIFNGFIAMRKAIKQKDIRKRFYYLLGYVRDCRLERRLLNDYESKREERIHVSIGIFCAVIFVICMDC